MAAVAIFAIALTFGMPHQDAHAHLITLAQRDLNSVLMRASNEAISSREDGATIAVSALPGNQSQLRVYLGRPDLAAPIRLIETDRLPAPFTLADGTSSFAIVVAKDGSATVASGWTDWTQVAAPAACSTVNVILGGTGWMSPQTLQCQTMSI